MFDWLSAGDESPAYRPSDSICSLLNGAEDANGEHDDGADKLKDTADGNSDNAEWEQEEPDDGIEDKGQQSQWPTKYQEDAPEEEFCHCVLLLMRIRGNGRDGSKGNRD